MKAWIASRLEAKSVRFVLVGGWNTVFGFACFALLYRLTRPFEIHWLTVALVSHVIAVTNAYVCYKLFVFRTRGNVLPEYLRFCVAYAGLFLLQMGLLAAFVSGFGWHPVVSQAIVTFIAAVTSFFAHDRVTFRSGRVSE